MAPFISSGPPIPAAFDERFALFLAASAAVDCNHPAVQLLASEVRRPGDIDTMRVAYETVRDRYPHSMDIAASAVSVSASDVLRHGHGICFAKSHLLAAVLRACGIAAGLSYQKLAGGDRTYLHALNAVWLRDQRRWIRLDARGNKPGIDAKFSIDIEYLAFPIRPDREERDFAEIYARPLPSTLAALRNSQTVKELVRQLPDDLSAEDRREADGVRFCFEHLRPTLRSVLRRLAVPRSSN
jgi:transglutaminase-like putative cysteine protease